MPIVAPPFRAATPEDAPALAELINLAGEGLPYYLWGRMAGPGESAWEVGRRRVLRDGGGSSWRKGIVVEEGGAVVACLFGYPLPDAPEPIDAAMPAMFVPLQELENLAPGTWYVNILAVAPAQRGRGIGASLLQLADRLGQGCSMSVIVADANQGAWRLYERCGYRRRATRAMVKESWQNPATNWVLLLKGADGTDG
jgi:ribosomal protein S18 acetylase RimI-like enzyme